MGGYNGGHNPSTLMLLFVAIVAVPLSGCVVPEGLSALSRVGSGSFERLNKQKQLERVARDWCLTIRASQVIPIYPLDEDVQPGDVYIVDTPISQLKKFWNERGYLPIDHRFDRIIPTGYADYYHGGYGVELGTNVPRHWQFPPNAGAAGTPNETAWPSAPHAGFPSYSFKVKRGESFQGAIPVKGIPIMLGALGAREVSGSVVLSNAFTYGIDEPSLRSDVQQWADENQSVLADYAPEEGRTSNVDLISRRKGSQSSVRNFNFLRVITRVYLVKGVTITLTNTGASAWKLSAGDPKDEAGQHVQLGGEDDKLLQALESALGAHALESTSPAPDPPSGTLPSVPATGTVTPEERELALRERELAIEERMQGFELREKMLDRAFERAASGDEFGGHVVPGGTLKVASSTGRTISMIETFPRPLVVGYHALEFAILENGFLSRRPVSTYKRLDFNLEPSYEFVPVSNVPVSLYLREVVAKDPAVFRALEQWLKAEGINVGVFDFVTLPKYQQDSERFVRENPGIF